MIEIKLNMYCRVAFAHRVTLQQRFTVNVLIYTMLHALLFLEQYLIQDRLEYMYVYKHRNSTLISNQRYDNTHKNKHLKTLAFGRQNQKYLYVLISSVKLSKAIFSLT